MTILAALLSLSLCGQANAQTWAGVTTPTYSCAPTAQLTGFNIIAYDTIGVLTGANPGPGHSMTIKVGSSAWPWNNPCTYGGSRVDNGYTCQGVVSTDTSPVSKQAGGMATFVSSTGGWYGLDFRGYQDAAPIYDSGVISLHCEVPPICWSHPEACGQTPIIVPLHAPASGDGNNGNTVNLTDAAHGVVFDIAGDGNPLQVAWTADDQSGFLAIDRDGDGLITSGRELFGNHMLPSADSGFIAIHDLLGTGAIFHAGDPGFDRLLIWVDRNHNGISEPDELIKANTVLTAIQTGSTWSGKRDRYGNLFREKGRAKYVGQPQDDFDPNSWRPVYDVTLQTLPQ